MSSLPSLNRFDSSDYVEMAQSYTRKLIGDLLIIKYSPHSELKVGFKIRKKLFKHAVVRNAIRRTLKELIRVQLKLGQTGKYLVTLRKGGCKLEVKSLVTQDWYKLIEVKE